MDGPCDVVDGSSSSEQSFSGSSSGSSSSSLDGSSSWKRVQTKFMRTVACGKQSTVKVAVLLILPK